MTQENSEKSHRSVSLYNSLLDRADKFVGAEAGYGYKSLASFVEDAVRRRIEQLEREYRLRWDEE